MKLGISLLRLFFPKDEKQRMELRERIAASSAHTEDLQRTVILDADAIRTAILRFRSANDPQQVVQFDTLAPICKDKGPTIAGIQFCSHEKSGPGQRCEQHTCPVIVGRTREAEREVA